MLRIVDIVEAGGSRLTFPSRTMYLNRDTGPDRKKGREAMETIRRWQQQDEMPFPDFSPGNIEEMDNKLAITP